MKNLYKNRILLIVLNDDTLLTFTVPLDIKPEDHFKNILLQEGIDPSKVKKNFFFPWTEYSLDQYQYHFDIEKEKIDETSLAIEFKLEEFRKRRMSMFNVLDLEFMKSLEEDCQECKDHVVGLKNFFRDLPNTLTEKLLELPVEDIINFNPFNNVLKVNIINGGSGYPSPPTIEIDPPNGSRPGLHAKAVATIKDGSVTGVIMTQYGSGYVKPAKALVSAPQDENGEPAILIPAFPENDIYTEES